MYLKGLPDDKQVLVEVNTDGEFPGCAQGNMCNNTQPDGLHRFILPDTNFPVGKGLFTPSECGNKGEK